MVVDAATSFHTTKKKLFKEKTNTIRDVCRRDQWGVNVPRCILTHQMKFLLARPSHMLHHTTLTVTIQHN